jgi:hypothetical protein
MNPTIAIQGEHFVLSFEAHTIRIPLDRHDQLVAVLMARQRGTLKIAEPGAPTQWQIDHAEAIDLFLANRRRTALAELGL